MQLGSKIDVGALTFRPPRAGPTLWEIGIPDRSAAEFFIPDVKENINNLYTTFDKLVATYLKPLSYIMKTWINTYNFSSLKKYLFI